MGMLVSICGSAWNQLGKMIGGESLEDKTATVTFKCVKCGTENTVETKVTKKGLDIGNDSVSGFQSQCPWNIKQK